VITLVLHLLRLFPFLIGGHCQLALENLALRQQLTVYKRSVPRWSLHTMDRLFWVGLARVWTGWRQALVIVSPDTVLCWQRRRFSEYWIQLSRRPTGGRSCVNAEISSLVLTMATAHPLWEAPRIHGELLKLGIDVAERTVSRLMPRRRPAPSQTWRTFLANHVRDLVSIARLRVLFVPCRPHPPLPAGRALQRHGAPHRRLDHPADRGRLPERLRAAPPPARS
jgi:putative transposase